MKKYNTLFLLCCSIIPLNQYCLFRSARKINPITKTAAPRVYATVSRPIERNYVKGIYQSRIAKAQLLGGISFLGYKGITKAGLQFHKQYNEQLAELNKKPYDIYKHIENMTQAVKDHGIQAFIENIKELIEKEQASTIAVVLRHLLESKALSREDEKTLLTWTINNLEQMHVLFKNDTDTFWNDYMKQAYRTLRKYDIGWSNALQLELWNTIERLNEESLLTDNEFIHLKRFYTFLLSQSGILPQEQKNKINSFEHQRGKLYRPTPSTTFGQPFKEEDLLLD